MEPEGTSLSTWQCLNKEAHSFKQLNRDGTSEEKQGNGLKNAGIFLSFGLNHHSTPTAPPHIPVPDTLGLENAAGLEATLFWIPREAQQPKAAGGEWK